MTWAPFVTLATNLPFVLMATAGFAVLFDVPRRALALATGIGLIGYLARQVLAVVGVTPEPATYLAALVIGLLSQEGGQRLRLPIVILTVPAVIPLIPGVPAFRAVVDFVNADYLSGLANVVRAILIASAIGAGLGTVTAVVRMRDKPVY